MAPSVFDRFEMPACARTLGWKLIEADPERGEIRVLFEGRPEFCNPGGAIQGGFVTAMLDDCMGPAVLVKTDGQYYAATIEQGVQFIAPARCGPLFGMGRVVSMGRSVGFLAGELRDQDGALLATSTASVRLISTAKLPSGKVED